MAVLTCHTAGCPNAGVPIELDITDPDTGQAMPAVCGPCGRLITDVT
ncbi:MAG: hypothetical protein ACJ71Y_03930 [Blastococcus sp.]|jgi:hypothetical protein